jgi:hypothetical protein
MPRARLLARLPARLRCRAQKSVPPESEAGSTPPASAGNAAEVPGQDSSVTAWTASNMPWRCLIKAMVWANSRYVLGVVGTILLAVVFYLLGADELVEWLRATAVAGAERLN